jgi:hypothetical protein
LCAVTIPKLAGLCGRLFDEPSASAHLTQVAVLRAALLMPPLLFVVGACRRAKILGGGVSTSGTRIGVIASCLVVGSASCSGDCGS